MPQLNTKTQNYVCEFVVGRSASFYWRLTISARDTAIIHIFKHIHIRERLFYKGIGTRERAGKRRELKREKVYNKTSSKIIKSIISRTRVIIINSFVVGVFQTIKFSTSWFLGVFFAFFGCGVFENSLFFGWMLRCVCAFISACLYIYTKWWRIKWMSSHVTHQPTNQ